MLKGKERQMVLDYLYQECIKNSRDSFMSRKKMTCKIESQWNYESLSNKERVHNHQPKNNNLFKRKCNKLVGYRFCKWISRKKKSKNRGVGVQ